MTASEHETQRETVRQSLASVHHPDVFGIRRPVLCSICEAPSSHGSACDGCEDALYVTCRVTYA